VLRGLHVLTAGSARWRYREPVIEGVFIAESLREDTVVDLGGLSLGTVTRVRPSNTTPDQPPVWTLVAFTSTTADPQALGARFSDALTGPGWYVDFHTEDSTYLIVPGEVITYRRGDPEGRASAIERARAHGIPDSQLDWPE
jgi:hypothetical protein